MWSIEESPYEEGYLRCPLEDNLAQEVILAARTPGGADQGGPAPRWVAFVSLPREPGAATSVDNLLADINRKATIVHTYTCSEWAMWTESRARAVSSSSDTAEIYDSTGADGSRSPRVISIRSTASIHCLCKRITIIGTLIS